MGELETNEPSRDDMDIQHFALAGLLPPGHTLAVYERLGIIAHLTCEAGAPKIRGAHHFGDVELLVILPLLLSYPRYCPSEVLLAHFNSIKVTPAAIERAREQLDQATQDRTWEQVMKSAVAVLSRCRTRLADLGIKVVSRPRQGYQLLLCSEERSTDQ